MGFGGISVWQLLIVAFILVMLFGTKKLRGLGGDLGSALKGFKKAMSDEEQKAAAQPELEASFSAESHTTVKNTSKADV